MATGRVSLNPFLFSPTMVGRRLPVLRCEPAEDNTLNMVHQPKTLVSCCIQAMTIEGIDKMLKNQIPIDMCEELEKERLKKLDTQCEEEFRLGSYVNLTRTIQIRPEEEEQIEQLEESYGWIDALFADDAIQITLHRN